MQSTSSTENASATSWRRAHKESNGELQFLDLLLELRIQSWDPGFFNPHHSDLVYYKGSILDPVFLNDRIHSLDPTILFRLL